MQRLIGPVVLLLAFLVIDCVAQIDEPEDGVEPTGGSAGVEKTLPLDEDTRREIENLRAFEEQMKAGLVDPEDPNESAYQQRTKRRLGDRKAGVLLARRSPHVAMVKDYTKLRQWWTSTLQARGDGPPDLWVECTSWETRKGSKRKHGLPEGCAGVWKAGHKNWVKVRSYAIQLVKMAEPPQPVQGTPTTWGGVMDIWQFLERHPGACWLPSPGTRNYFFGQRGLKGNVCQELSSRLVEKSKAVSTQIMLRDMRRLKQEDNARRAAEQHK